MAIVGATLIPILDQTLAARSKPYTIFEGTSEIQRLVIARAISGLHIR
ncbi:acyl-CoA dehydrogenase family protein [Pseudofrankia sp. BMG5.36]